MSNILNKILSRKQEEVTAARAYKSLDYIKKQALAAPIAKDFAGALLSRIKRSKTAVIAEIKSITFQRCHSRELRPRCDCTKLPNAWCGLLVDFNGC